MNKESILDFFSKDFAIGRFVESYGYLPDLSPTGSTFQALCKSIVSQQLSTGAAATIYSRFSNLIGDTARPELILNTKPEDLRSVGLSNQKATYIKNVCDFWLDKGINDQSLIDYNDHELTDMLTKIKGVGEWTVQMLLIFHFQRPNVLPVGDLIVRNGIIHFYQLNPESKNVINECKEATQHWQPYASYGSRYMWAFKDQIK